MTLGFSTKWPKQMGVLAGQPNHFQDKIWNGLIRHDVVIDENVLPSYENNYKDKFGSFWDWQDEDDCIAKLHTFREDPSNRWKAGNDIHMVVYNQTKHRFQFAPVLKCTGTQKIEIEWHDHGTLLGRTANVYVDVTKRVGWYDEKDKTWRNQTGRSLEALAQNDGFNSVEDFFAYFNTDFKGKIIHWTDLKY